MQRIAFLNAFCLEAQRDMKAGDEITCDYGATDKTPWMMFSTYGFSLPNRLHDGKHAVSDCRQLRHLANDITFADGATVQRNFQAFLHRSCLAGPTGDEL